MNCPKEFSVVLAVIEPWRGERAGAILGKFTRALLQWNNVTLIGFLTWNALCLTKRQYSLRTANAR